MRVSTFQVESWQSIERLAGGLAGFRLFFFGLFFLSTVAPAGEWIPLAKDGIHDPRSRGTKILQQPQEALTGLTPDTAGNQVRWVQALEKGDGTPARNACL